MTTWTLPSPALIPTTAPGKLEQLQTSEVRRALTAAGVAVEAIETDIGPQVVRYRVTLGAGTTARKAELQTDAVSLATGRTARFGGIVGTSVAFEVPRAHRGPVGLREMLTVGDVSGALRFPVGRDVAGCVIDANLAALPHLLVAGTTGGGKSEFVNALLTGLLMAHTPEELRLVLIDPKRVELSAYAGLPHLLTDIVTDVEDAPDALSDAVAEMTRRYQLFEGVNVKSLGEFNSLIEHGRDIATNGLDPLPRLVVVVDELADLMMTAPKAVEAHLIRLGAMGRAAGIHLVLATQRPAADIVTAKIKANIPGRAVFMVNTHRDSLVALDYVGAERLTGKGDGLFRAGGEPMRFQGALVTAESIEFVVKHWAMQAPTTTLAPPVVATPVEADEDNDQAIRDALRGKPFNPNLPPMEQLHLSPHDVLVDAGITPVVLEALTDAIVEKAADRIADLVTERLAALLAAGGAA